MHKDEQTTFLIANFPYTLDISNDNAWHFVQKKFERDFPWLLGSNYRIVLCGVANGWRGQSERNHVASCALFRKTGKMFLDAPLAWLSHLIWAWRFSRKGKVIGISPTPESGLGIALVRWILPSRIRLVVRVQGYTASKALFVHGSIWRHRILDIIENFVLRKADLVVPMGKFTSDLAIAKGVVPEKIVMLPFPVRWANSAAPAPFPEEPCVAFVGRLEKEKGVHVLLEAMAKVIMNISSVRLLIAGDGSMRPALEDMASRIGLGNQVFFLGWLNQEDLMHVYQKAWVLVLPSILAEGLGMVLIEAGLMGRPVIGSDLGGIRDVILHGQNGFLVPPGNPDALADALITLLSDREQAERMGQVNIEVAKRYLAGRDEAVERTRRAILSLIESW